MLEGWDGSVWDLRTGPAALTDGGVQGLKGLEYESYVQDTAIRDGQLYKGGKAKPRDVMLPILLGKGIKDEQEWLQLSTKWWHMMRPGKYNTLWVNSPDGSVRTLSIRFLDDGNGGTDIDPTRVLREIWPIRLVADDPWYYGDDFGRDFKAQATSADTAPVDFYGGGAIGAGGYGPPYYIGRTNRSDTTELVNPGDTDVWPIIEFDDAISRFKVTVGDGVLSGETPKLQVLTGQTLRIETSPVRQVALRIDRATGLETNVTRQLSGWGFRRIPEGKSTNVKIEVENEGGYRVIAVPQYLRGW